MLSARPISLGADVDLPTHSILTTKTPGRKVLKGRGALQENALQSGAKTVLSKKNVLKTPLRPGTVHGKRPVISVSVTRPLTDKTPFPNRTAAANFGVPGKTPGLKLSKLALLAPQPEQDCSPDVAPLLRPSSTRKSLRGRLSQNFKTPLTKGNYWDVSPGDMEGLGGGLVQEAKQEPEVVVVDEDDEIEYMPPCVIERPYEPPFALPDYQTLGQRVFNIGHGACMDDTADAFYSADIEQQIDVKALLNESGCIAGPSKIVGLDLPELEDDSPFARKPSKPVPSSSRIAVALARTSSARAAPPSRIAPPPRPATTIPGQTHARSSSRSTASPPTSAPPLVLAPGQTRTSALRAAKNAAAASTPNPVLGTRPPPAAKRPTAVSSAATTSGLPVRAVSGPAGSARARSATTSAPAPPLTARPRSATVLGRPKAVAGAATGAGKGKAASVGLEDGLAAILEKAHGGDGAEDFAFDV